MNKLKGHNLKLYKRDESNIKNEKYIRVCQRCKLVQSYKWIPILLHEYIWVNLVAYTKNVGMAKIKSLDE
jgi:hypothetical protein